RKDIEKQKANLPHWQQGQTWVFVTWRLKDSLPKPVVKKLNMRRIHWERSHPKPWNEETHKEHNRLFTMRFEQLLDDSQGSCLLAEERHNKTVANAFFHFHGERYNLDSFVVMPNHVHVLFQPLLRSTKPQTTTATSGSTKAGIA
ncbi:MAG: hypothetical protein ACSHX7_06575, partial [Luteolibacter sp.]